jgi:hypothetical protein
MLLSLIAAGAVILMFAAFVLLRRAMKEPEPSYHFQCKHCRQKLRYRAESQGRRIMCPQCLRPCTVPPATQRTAV